MDFSKLDSNEQLATYGAVAVVIAGLISSWGGLLFLAILAALAMLVIVFLPQFSPQTSLPGSKGSLMAAVGILAAVIALITALNWIRFLSAFGFSAVMLLVAVVGAVVMAWAGWQELQSEGGRWRFGAAATASASGAPPAGDEGRVGDADREPVVEADTATTNEERRTEA